MEQFPHIPIDNVIPFAGSEQTEDYVSELRAKIGAWQPPTNDKWTDLANPILVTTRIAHIIIMRLSCAETQGAVAECGAVGLWMTPSISSPGPVTGTRKWLISVLLRRFGSSMAPEPKAPWREPSEAIDEAG
jgi:hypothetical protein